MMEVDFLSMRRASPPKRLLLSFAIRLLFGNGWLKNGVNSQ